MIFGDGLEQVGKPVVDETNKEPVDLRTKPEEGAGENAEPDEAAIAQAAEEKETRKEEFLATGKTEAEFEEAELAEQTRLEAEKNKTPEELAEEKRVAEEAKAATDAKDAEALRVKLEMRAEYLKELGVNSEEELKAKLNPLKPKTPEQLAQEAQIYDMAVANYAVDQKILSKEEWLAVNNMKKAPDSDLVFQNFSHEYKEANKDRKTDANDADPVTDEEIKDKFNELYHIDSDNKALKEQGEKNLALKAKDIRGPLEKKLADAHAFYDDEIAQKQAVPDFRTFVQGIIATALPKNLEYGTGDDKVSIDLSKITTKELEDSLFATGIAQREFQDFMTGKGTPEQKARIEREIQKELLYRTHQEIAKENFKAGLSKGKKTAAPGANARFIEPGKREQQQQTVKVTDEDNAKVQKAFA